MTAVAYTAIKDAIHAWFVASSGLAADRVIYYGQNLNRPAGAPAYISLRIKEDEAIGQDWTDHVVNPTPTAGAELLSKTRGQRRFTLQATCFPPMPTDGSAVADASEAQAILSEVRSAAAVPARRRALRVAGIGLGALGTIVPIDGTTGGRFEARAMFSFVFFAKSEITANETIIETVVLTTTVDGNELEPLNIDLTPE